MKKTNLLEIFKHFFLFIWKLKYEIPVWQEILIQMQEVGIINYFVGRL